MIAIDQREIAQKLAQMNATQAATFGHNAIGQCGPQQETAQAQDLVTVGQVLTGLEKTVAVLAESVGSLEDRLAPVLRAGFARNGNGSPTAAFPEAATCDIAALIHQHSKAIEATIARLWDLKARIAL